MNLCGCKEDITTGACKRKIILWSRNSFFPPWDHLDDDATGVAFSPDGKTLAEGSRFGIILWDLESRQPIGQPLNVGRSVWSVVFSPDGTWTLNPGWNTPADKGDIRAKVKEIQSKVT